MNKSLTSIRRILLSLTMQIATVSVRIFAILKLLTGSSQWLHQILATPHLKLVFSYAYRSLWLNQNCICFSDQLEILEVLLTKFAVAASVCDMESRIFSQISQKVRIFSQASRHRHLLDRASEIFVCE